MNNDILTRLMNVFIDNGCNATASVGILVQMINAEVVLEQLQACNQVRCADHSVQLAVLQLARLKKKCLEQLQYALIRIRKSKVMFQAYRTEEAAVGLETTEPTHLGSPTR